MDLKRMRASKEKSSIGKKYFCYLNWPGLSDHSSLKTWTRKKSPANKMQALGDGIRFAMC
jgi:hypothetical protein